MDFFDINLGSKTFNINGEDYKILLQMHIIPLQCTPNHILVLTSKTSDHKLKIIAWNEKLKKIHSISHVDVKQVVDAIRKMPLDDKIRTCVSEIDIENFNYESIRFETLASGIEMLIAGNETPVLSDTHKVESEFDGTRLCPSFFVYGAYNGLDLHVYFELEDSQIPLINNWGILSPIRIYIDNSLFGEFHAQNTYITEKTISFKCEPQIVATVKRRETGWIRTEKISPIDLSDFLISTAGLHDKVAFPENHLSTPQWYVVATPILGLNFIEDFGIGNVQFCTASSKEIAHILEFSPKLTEYDNFALVNVNSNTLYHAFSQAKKQIEQAVDLLVNIIKDDSLYSIHGMGEHLLCRNSMIFEQKISIPSWVYIEVPFTGGKLLSNYAEIVKQEKIDIPDSFKLLKHELNNIELLLLKSNGTNDKELTPLFNSLKWIRRAWDADDYDDKVIYYMKILTYYLESRRS